MQRSPSIWRVSAVLGANQTGQAVMDLAPPKELLWTEQPWGARMNLKLDQCHSRISWQSRRNQMWLWSLFMIASRSKIRRVKGWTKKIKSLQWNTSTSLELGFQMLKISYLALRRFNRRSGRDRSTSTGCSDALRLWQRLKVDWRKSHTQTRSSY